MTPPDQVREIARGLRQPVRHERSWSERSAAMRRLHALLLGGAAAHPHFIGHVSGTLCELLGVQLSDLRSKCVKQARATTTATTATATTATATTATATTTAAATATTTTATITTGGGTHRRHRPAPRRCFRRVRGGAAAAAAQATHYAWYIHAWIDSMHPLCKYEWRHCRSCSGDATHHLSMQGHQVIHHPSMQAPSRRVCNGHERGRRQLRQAAAPPYAVDPAAATARRWRGKA